MCGAARDLYNVLFSAFVYKNASDDSEHKEARCRFEESWADL